MQLSLHLSLLLLQRLVVWLVLLGSLIYSLSALYLLVSGEPADAGALTISLVLQSAAAAET